MVRSYTISNKESSAFPLPDFSRDLNAEQLSAVQTNARHALVIAGAGSGKTRTLTYRVARLLAEGVPPWRIMLLTFTNKAAHEMMNRVSELTASDISALQGGTFHSTANRILRRHASLLGYTPSFSILDTEDRKSLLKRLIKEYGDTRKSSRFPKADVLSTLFGLATNRGENWSDVLRAEYYYLQEYEEQIGKIHTAFQESKRSGNSMDFDDLLVNVVTLLCDHPDVKEAYRNRFLHILVDEYQDTNALQDEFIDLLAGADETSLMAVGDDAQSIYSWRGADVSHILEFKDRFPDAEIFKIETNYRSVPSILELSNAAISANTRQYAKTLHAARAEGEMIPALIPAPDSRVEALFVAQRIGELIESGISPCDIAVLYRGHYHSLDVQMALTRAEIPYRVTSGVRFFEQAHVKDVMALIRLASNPRDEASFRRIVLSFPKVGDVMATKLWTQWTCLIDAESGGRFADRYENAKISATVRPYWDALMQALDGLKVEEGKWRTPAEVVQCAVEYLNPTLQVSYDDYEDRYADLETLARAAADFANLDDFLAQTALLSNTDREETSAETPQQVTLSTIHQAKGLEWKVVFLIALCEGSFPNRRVADSGDPNAMEEELRLFYVAITRAEDQLYLSYSKINLRNYDGAFHQYPSRFLSYCPSELMEQWEL